MLELKLAFKYITKWVTLYILKTIRWKVVIIIALFCNWMKRVLWILNNLILIFHRIKIKEKGISH